ncbi:DUF2332 domain-containing protein [Dermatobacter hominis]|uniref:DUF2332 domain-containing protein n=1 Tax=Dermatobacter hominis TaxID=2884263 RepID=UPI001D101281|nr:DUF2332 domain-containing protein [Dermatobacter hominis]UDY38013.1 DUF2332 domain-containing protein [Dermatobacter hominis]
MGEERAGSAEWAGRYEQQAIACDALGSPLWGRLLRVIAHDVLEEGPSWSVVRERADLRFGQAGPLRLVGAAHRLGLSGAAERWAALLPSCGGVAPDDDASGDSTLRDAWLALIDLHRDELVDGLGREVQTNEVGRAVALGYAHAVALGHRHVLEGAAPARLIELGCSGGLNLRLDHFRLDLSGAPGAGTVLGDPDGAVRLAPEVRTPLEPGVVTVPLVERTGIDIGPIDPTTEDGRLTLLSFVWPDQLERFERLAAAIDVARQVPAHVVQADVDGGRSTAHVLDGLLSRPAGPGVATIVQHSIVWQYIPTDQRPAVTSVIERAGRRATADAPLVWIRFEPDEWDRTRVAVWARRWPDGGDRLIAHGDFHGRWLAPVAAP